MINIKYTSNGLLEFNRDSRFRGINGRGQTVVVIDTGIDLNHAGFGPDRNNNGISDRIIRKDLDFTSSKDGTVQDTIGHGTATAGVVASIAKGVRIIPIQVSTASGVSRALEWAVANEDRYNITAVNLSMSMADNTMNDYSNEPTQCGSFCYKEFDKLYDAGIAASVAAGNYYQYYETTGLQRFAAYWQNNGVMATNSNGLNTNDTLATFSQRRSDALGAPGVGLEVFKRDALTTKGSGTSFASPFVAGCLQLLQGVSEKYLHRELTPDELTNITQLTADSIGNSGYKQINVFKAAEAIWTLGNCNKLATASDDSFIGPLQETNLSCFANSSDNSFV